MIARASKWTSIEVARAVGGELVGPDRRTFFGVSTDTRDALDGQLFVALVGDNFDAHDFLDRAVAGGAAGLLVQRDRFDKTFADNVAVVTVDDTLYALGELAKAHRRRLNTPVVALTGSNGKTTTKELLAGIFAAAHSTLKTQGNLNNLIGVPMTMLGIEEGHEVAVVEMGMNQPNEIARYTEIAEPVAGMVINVQPAHIGKLGSLAAIAAAKGELYDGLAKDAVAIVNADDPEVVRIAAARTAGPTRTFGTGEGVDVRLVASSPIDAERQRVTWRVDGVEVVATIPFVGTHNAMNATAAVAAATSIPELVAASHDDIVNGLAKVAPVARRLLPRAIGPYLVIDDSYNANGASMIAALETVASRKSRFGALFGEMRELGSHSESEHRRVGEAAARLGAAFVVSFGGEARAITDAAASAGVSTHHEDDDFEAAYAAVRDVLERGDVLLVKGSRGMRMERFIERLAEEQA